MYFTSFFIIHSSAPHFLVNPAAGNGKAARRWKQYEPQLRRAFPNLTIHLSSRSGQLREIAASLANVEAVRIVAVGGDGTHHEVVNGLYDALGSEKLPEIPYALLPLGSGNDWIRTHRIPRRLDQWIAAYQRDQLKQQNLGLIHYYNENGLPQQRIFTNVAGVAYDAYVVHRAEQSRFKSRLIYPLLTLAYLKDYHPPQLSLCYDDIPTINQSFHTINIGIGRYSGGGMRIVPQADPVGDQFALTYAPALSISTILAHSWRFYTPNIHKVPGVVCTHARRVSIEAADHPFNLSIEADGEWLGYGPLRFELIKNGLSFIG